ncbi:MAG: DEAD/DEAH box helicase family protein [Flavobacteriaceae bacterium]
MTNSLKDIKFPKTYSYSSDSEHVPFEFYNQAFPVSKRIDLFLGYFNSYTFSILSESFAEFIYNGGSMRIITNHFYSPLDKENLLNDDGADYLNDISEVLGDLKKLKEALDSKGKLFFDCLKYLKRNGRLQLQPVYFGKKDLSHKKAMLFYDDTDAILTMGSMNFTPAGIVKNGESFNVDVPWINKIFEERVDEQISLFDEVFNRKHPSYKYLDNKDIEELIDDFGENKSLEDLIKATIEENENEDYTYSERIITIKKKKAIEFKELLFKIKNEPRFPFDEGPRDYQKQAYEKWAENNCKGIFAMATGTGKTLTSLNAVLEEYKISGFYNAIILVPTQILVNQWINECKKFNFNNIFTTYDKNWQDKLKTIQLEKRLGINSNYIFISTYASYNGKKFQKIFENFKCQETILIADEAHNLGTKKSISNYLFGINKRIGLSATPNRNFDESGTYEIEKYFNSFSPNHTFSYTMLKAIKSGFLTPYFYSPKFIKLNETEMEAYAQYSERLLKFFDFEKGTYKEEASNLLIQRKRIIHQASNKKDKLIEILKEINDKDFKHTIVYVPEGFEPDYSITDISVTDDEDLRIIDDYNTTIQNLGIRTHQIIGGMNMLERENILKQFNDGLIQVLTAMKTLDEGVDIPATKCAIFCASTGNPRQFIQRRGRILRNNDGKEYATVYDLIIEPNDISYWNLFPKDKREKLQKMEINIFRNELYRVANFLYASENLSDLHIQRNSDIKKLVELTELYNLDIFSLINELIEIDNK